jgi:hypothetical protein
MPQTSSKATTLLKRPACGAVFFLVVLGVFSTCAPAFALWLPWATEEQKVKKTLNDVWQALIANDQTTLKRSLAGTGAKLFIDQERQKIKSFNIKSYDCTIKNVNIDQATKAWAFVEYQAVANLNDGKKLPMGSVAVLQKIGGEWKFLTGVKTQGIANQGKKDEKSAALQDDKGRQKPQPPEAPPASQSVEVRIDE